MMALPQHIDITRLQVDTRIIVETPNCIWDFTVVDPENALVKVYGTDPSVKDNKPVCGRLLQTYDPAEGVSPDERSSLKHSLAKAWIFQVQFSNLVLIGGPIESARVEGDGWSFEAIE